jgi:hypothetical protein
MTRLATSCEALGWSSVELVGGLVVVCTCHGAYTVR